MDPSPFSQSSAEVVEILFQSKQAREYYCCTLRRKAPHFQGRRTMMARSLRPRNLRSCADRVESLLSTGIIQMGARCSANTNSSNHFSTEFDRKSATRNQNLPVHIMKPL